MLLGVHICFTPLVTDAVIYCVVYMGFRNPRDQDFMHCCLLLSSHYMK